MIAADPWAWFVISHADDRSDRRAVDETRGELVLGATAAEHVTLEAAQEKVRWIRPDLMGGAIDLSPGYSVVHSSSTRFP